MHNVLVDAYAKSTMDVRMFRASAIFVRTKLFFHTTPTVVAGCDDQLEMAQQSYRIRTRLCHRPHPSVPLKNGSALQFIYLHSVRVSRDTNKRLRQE